MQTILSTSMTVLTAALLSLVSFQPLAAQSEPGSIKGTVINAQTQQYLPGATIQIEGSKRGTISNAAGEFSIGDLEPGAYTLKITMLGYAPFVKTDVIIRPARTTSVEIGLTETVIESEGVEVSAGAFSSLGGERISRTSFNAEEARRAPGTGGDVGRVLTTLPSVAQTDNREAGLAVRGGSPAENAYYIDHIPVPNINHFPSLGNASGAISLLNMDFVDDISLRAGGFNAQYADRLSSVVGIEFREGNRDSYDAQLDINATGFGGGIEGPLPGVDGSFMVSAKRSFLDLLVNGLGTGIAPRFANVQGKGVIDLGQNNRLTILEVYGEDDFIMDKDDAIDNEDREYGQSNSKQNTVGLTWRRLWDGPGYSKTSISYSLIDRDENWSNVKDDILQLRTDVRENLFNFRNTNYYEFSDAHRLEFGADASMTTGDYLFEFGATVNPTNSEPIPAFAVSQNADNFRGGAFASWTWSVLPQLELTGGLRADYYDWNEEVNIAPRVSASWLATQRLTINAAWGQYYQTLPMSMLAQSALSKELATPRADHAVLGADYMLTSDTKLSIEGYYKTYTDMPLDPNDPVHFPVDAIGLENSIDNSAGFVGGGEARSWGTELMIQKKLAEDFYGIISGSWFRSEYKDLTGVWRDRSYDNRYMASIIGGFKPNNVWEFSARWTIAGGRPYTPIDLEASNAVGFQVYDASRPMGERMPVYHNLNVRVDRRFNFAGSSLIVYLDVWNVYNQENVAFYRWDKEEGDIDTELQWSTLPVLGMEFEF